MKLPSQKTHSERFLAIETSSPRLSLALGTTQQVLKTYQGPLEWRHADSLFTGMEKLLGQLRWPVQSLTGVVVSIGPGSFTGIRIGLAAARALGQSLEIPVVGIPSLQALAYSSMQPGGYVCPLINALRGEVFTALYTQDKPGKLKTLWKECRWPLAQLIEELESDSKDELWLVGDAIPLYREELKSVSGNRWHFVAAEAGYPQASALIQLGGKRLSKADRSSYQEVVPLYLRSAAAQERRLVR